MLMELQGNGRCVKSSPVINAIRNLNGYTPVCTFFNNTRLLHERAVRRIEKHLTSTSTYVDLRDRKQRLNTSIIVYKPEIEKYIKGYVDDNFSGRWAQAASDNA